jgi:hypothetical protein
LCVALLFVVRYSSNNDQIVSTIMGCKDIANTLLDIVLSKDGALRLESTLLLIGYANSFYIHEILMIICSLMKNSLSAVSDVLKRDGWKRIQPLPTAEDGN